MSESSLRLLAEINRVFPWGRDIVLAMRDPEQVTAIREALERIGAPDFVTDMAGDESFRSERTGVEGFLTSWSDWVDSFDEFHIELEELVEAGDNLITLVHQRGRPHGSSGELTNDAAAVWFIKDERLVRVEFHLDRELARRSAGLEPS